VPGLLSVPEAQSCLDYAEFLSFQPSNSSAVADAGFRGPAYGEAFRDNGHVSVHDPAIAAALWHDTGLAGLLGSKLRMGGRRPLGCNPNIRFYRCQLLSPCSTAIVLQHLGSQPRAFIAVEH
ncbi:hypothetical protein QJQ45_021757, partial [Haematococcus lacustris]